MLKLIAVSFMQQVFKDQLPFQYEGLPNPYNSRLKSLKSI